MTKFQMPNTRFGVTAGAEGEPARAEGSGTLIASSVARPSKVSVGCASGFTLIELLVTIAIIGVLAGLVLPLSGIATTKMRIARVKTELNRYVNAIETYKLETGEYPPDHGLLSQVNTNDQKLYHERAALNPLAFELRGSIYSNRLYYCVTDNNTISAGSFDKIFRRRGIRNSARNKNDIDFKGFTLREGQIGDMNPQPYGGSQNEELELLKVPVPGPFMLESDDKVKFNPWFYDASNTNRHNKNSYDLWAEIIVGGKTNIIGNWKQ
jgi:prepilin-type N-terminal cleavage/methylation domain-containing protein